MTEEEARSLEKVLATQDARRFLQTFTEDDIGDWEIESETLQN
jgi:hypothetical protein